RTVVAPTIASVAAPDPPAFLSENQRTAAISSADRRIPRPLRLDYTASATRPPPHPHDSPRSPADENPSPPARVAAGSHLRPAMPIRERPGRRHAERPGEEPRGLDGPVRRRRSDVERLDPRPHPTGWEAPSRAREGLAMVPRPE